jgi:hypothetical protein
MSMDGQGTDGAAPGELELQRRLGDIAARVELTAGAHRRQAQMQRLMAKALALSDREFESAVTTLEGLIDRYHAERTGGSDAAKPKPANVVADVEKKLGGLIQTQGK